MVAVRSQSTDLIRSGPKKTECSRDGSYDDCNQKDQIGVSAKELYACASLVCPSVTVELISCGDFKPPAHRKQSENKILHDF